LIINFSLSPDTAALTVSVAQLKILHKNNHFYKTSLGKLTIPENITGFMDKAVFNGFKILSIERENA